MKRQEEVIEMLKILKTSAKECCDSTIIEKVRLDSFTFVIDEAIKEVQRIIWKELIKGEEVQE